MGDFVTIEGQRYYQCADLLDGAAGADLEGDEEERQSFVTEQALKLDRTCGVVVPILGRELLFVIDKTTIAPGSEIWRFIGAVAQHLADHADGLSPEAQAGLTGLRAVVFSSWPSRAYADVQADCFVYDVDEFRYAGGQLISPAYAASNIVHDAYHVRMYEQGRDYAGVPAEIICWQLQVDNAEALAMTDWDANYIRGLIADPGPVMARISSDPVPNGSCQQVGRRDLGQGH
jgi:hypothetical protein